MEKLFVPFELALKLKEKGFKEDTIAKFSEIIYPIDDSGDSLARCKCLYIPLENRFDEIRMLWIENENAHFHWHEGTYTDGEHSRCELAGDDVNAPTYYQTINFIEKEFNMHISRIWYNDRVTEPRWVYHVENEYAGSSYDEAIEEALDF